MSAINRDNRVQFKDGTLRHTDEATYLGILTKTVHISTEISIRVASRQRGRVLIYFGNKHVVH